jgi:hypothetical protein
VIPAVTLAGVTPHLTVAPMVSSDGKATISWSLPESASVDLQKSHDLAFSNPVTLYQGVDEATVVTGLSNGEYHFRVRVVQASGQVSPWSEPVTLSVEHHSLVRAFIFFGIGAIVFIATLFLIFLGARRQG